VNELIVKQAKKGTTSNPILGLNASQIGVYLRDQQGIPQTRFLTGKKIIRILKKNGSCSIAMPRLCSSDPRGSLLADQEGRIDPQALGQKPKGY
jgi:hypothetical protein